MPESRPTLIRGATLASEHGDRQADILLDGERIAAVGPHLDARGAQVVDAAGLVALPGLIDVHVHVREPGAAAKEDWESATRAALAGGVTTLLDMPNNAPPTVSREAVREKLAIAARRALCDYGVYLGASADNVGLAAELAGEITGLKIYLGSTTGDLLTDDWGLLYRHLKATPSSLPVVVHAEDEQCLRAFRGSSPDDHDRNRPAICAELATLHVITAARAAGRGVHVAHVSTGEEVRIIAAARPDVPGLTCEVCPHHLYLTAEDAVRLGGWGKVNPPLRPAAVVQDLWAMLPLVDLVASDHAPHTAREKAQPYAVAPAGFPGLETTLPLLLLALRDGRLSLRRLEELAASAPARVFGLAGKGALRPGYDADVLLVDPGAQRPLDPAALQTKPRGTPFDGWTLPGAIRALWRRGELCVRDGAILAQPGSGRKVRRGI